MAGPTKNNYIILKKEGTAPRGRIMLKEGLEYLHERFTTQENYPRELKKWYEKNTGLKLDLNNPVTYNEKIQWIKLNYRNPLMTTLSDKYLVRDWIRDKIGEEYLVPLLGAYDAFSDIDFASLPDRFVMKTNHGSSWNIIVQDKSKFNPLSARLKFFIWMHLNYAYTTGYQLHYKNIKPKILIEKYLENEHGMLRDYKVLTFGGKAHYIWVDSDRFTDHHRNVYDLDWNSAPFEIGKHNLPEGISRPANLKLMVELTEKLAEGFPMVRVDFYEVDGRLYFGEMTFTNCSGIDLVRPPEYDKVLGDLIPLP